MALTNTMAACPVLKPKMKILYCMYMIFLCTCTLFYLIGIWQQYSTNTAAVKCPIPVPFRFPESTAAICYAKPDDKFMTNLRDGSALCERKMGDKDEENDDLVKRRSASRFEAAIVLGLAYLFFMVIFVFAVGSYTAPSRLVPEYYFGPFSEGL